MDDMLVPIDTDREKTQIELFAPANASPSTWSDSAATARDDAHHNADAAFPQRQPGVQHHPHTMARPPLT